MCKFKANYYFCQEPTVSLSMDKDSDIIRLGHINAKIPGLGDGNI
ncbi:protein of unknown function [Petrocella atlantisensis]|uniref:Uncharacterized protein n=1 Tax=Petrocella atlantisensis TaxID=2173034 RepID=A0A3P7PXU3_9FIRM|nr:protein of unknown function [Petrocella atlantisensis]